MAVNRGEGTAPDRRIMVLTSDREQILWEQENLWEAGLSAGSDPPRLLEPRWSRQSLEEFLGGAPQPTTAQILGEIRGYLQSTWVFATRSNMTWWRSGSWALT